MLALVRLGSAPLEIDFSVSLAPVSESVLLPLGFINGPEKPKPLTNCVPVQSGWA